MNDRSFSRAVYLYVLSISLSILPGPPPTVLFFIFPPFLIYYSHQAHSPLQSSLNTSIPHPLYPKPSLNTSCKMNTIDVSADPQFVKDLARQRTLFQAAQSRKGQKPRAGKPRADLILEFMFHLTISNNQPGYNLRTSFVPLAYPPCTSPLNDLKQIMIDDLRLETHHRGSYIVLRTVTPPHRMTALMAIVEDVQEDVVRLQMYHQDKTEKLMEEGTILLLKEPYLKASAADGGYAIRVDHLSDVIFLPKHDERIPNCWQPRLVEIVTSANEWKETGNAYFYKSEFREALDW